MKFPYLHPKIDAHVMCVWGDAWEENIAEDYIIKFPKSLLQNNETISQQHVNLCVMNYYEAKFEHWIGAHFGVWNP